MRERHYKHTHTLVLHGSLKVDSHCFMKAFLIQMKC